MLVSQMLRYARVLLTAGWSQGAEARDEQGRPVAPCDPLAAAWSLVGAVKAVADDAGDVDGELERHALTALAFVLETPVVELAAWNDERGRSHRDVLAACDWSIELVPQLVTRHVVGRGR